MLADVRLPLAPQQRQQRRARGRHRVGHLKRDAEHGGAAGARARAGHVANVRGAKLVAEPCRAKRGDDGLAERRILRQQQHAHAATMRRPPADPPVGLADVHVHVCVVARVCAFLCTPRTQTFSGSELLRNKYFLSNTVSSVSLALALTAPAACT